MSNLRRQAASALGDLINSQIKLNDPVTVISAPPSDVGDYPTVAVWLEHFSTEWHQEDEFGVNSDGDLLVGAIREIDNPVNAAKIDDDSRLSQIGMIHGRGRVWVGSRLPPKREEIEDQILELFTQDTMAPGRALMKLKTPRVGSRLLPWDWNVAIFVTETEWTDEFAFAERLWAWLTIEIEIPILVARTSDLISRIRLDVNAEFTHSGESNLDRDPADVVVDPATEHYTVASDGSVAAIV